MSLTVRGHRQPTVPDAETRIVANDPLQTPLSAGFSFLRPPQAPGEIGRLGGYRVFKLLGSGGMGKVFLAEDPALKRDVALKVMCLPPGEDLLSWRERFLREARALATTKHPNLVTVYQVGEDRGTVFLAMELLEGETLDARIKRESPLDVPEILHIAEEVLTGLSAIHAGGLIHRDIKPGNIWLGSATSQDTEPLEEDDDEPPAPVSHVKILDFGLVREMKSDTHLTEAGAVVGTPAYMSPEQVRGKLLDARTDLFSFGCVLYAMCTGKAPFASSSPMAQAAALAADEPVRVRELNPAVPARLSKLIAGLLAKKPDDRPVSATAVVERLREVASGKPTRKKRVVQRSFVRRHALKLVFAVWVVAATLVAVALVRDRRPAVGDAPPPPVSAGATVEFLTDLPKVNERVFPPPGAPRPPNTDGTVRVGGTRSPHGIFMHGGPGFDLPTFVSYYLDKKYSRFTVDVALNDTAGNWTGLIFVVIADENEVWTSGNISKVGKKETCDIDVTGVSVLRLEVRTMGPTQGAHGAWVEPRLTK